MKDYFCTSVNDLQLVMKKEKIFNIKLYELLLCSFKN